MAWPWRLALATDGGVWVVLSESGGPYAETATALRSELGTLPKGGELRVAPWQDWVATTAKPPQLIITLGAVALRHMIDLGQREPALGRVPILAALLPRTSYEALVPKPRPGISAVFLDQPAGRYLDLLRLAMPERKKIGVLLGPESAPLGPVLLKAATARGVRLFTAEVEGESEEIYPALKALLAEADVLLALPDNKVFNASSLQNILITTYRQRVPMVAFAAGYVKAGAAMALHVSPSQVASQTAAVARASLAGRGLPAPQMATDFSLVVNDRVARSLGVAVEDPAAIAEALKRMETGR